MAQMRRDYESKPGRFGTLWRYEYTYRDADEGPIWTRRGWYYSLDHLEAAFYESCDGDDTWVLLTARRVPLNGIMASVPTHVFSER